jgi:hypothetical protein
MKLGCSARVDDWNKMNECGTRGMDTTINIEYPLSSKDKAMRASIKKSSTNLPREDHCRNTRWHAFFEVLYN